MAADSRGGVAARDRSGGGGPGRGDGGPGAGGIVSVREAQWAAEQVLAPEIADFVAGGSGGELTVAANRSALDNVQLVPRVLSDVSDCHAAVDVLGCPARMPVAIAPMAFQRIVHADGELGLARAARDAGIPYTAGILSSVPLEEIAAEGGTTWFQLYWLRDRGQLADLLGRAERAGCRGLMLSVDLPAMGRRSRDLRNGFSLPPGVIAANLSGQAQVTGEPGSRGRSGPAAHTARAMDPSLSWADVEWLRGRTALPLVLKGILDPRDAARAADLGVRGIVVSNHGGRQLDGAVAAITMLAEVADAVRGRCEVMFDGGIRSGSDVLKAVALGANAVLLGRPALWGLAADGERGAGRVLTLLKEEVVNAMALAGCRDVAAVRGLRTVAAAGCAAAPGEAGRWH